MPVKSLVDLASRACIKNIKHLDSIGDFLPYENVRHILVRVEHADQLHRIEINSPQIQGHTGELWLKLIEKDFPLEFKAKAYKPSDPKKWYKVYGKYKKEHDEKKEESERQLRAAMAGLKEDRAKNTSKIVNRKQLPRNGATGPKRTGWGRDSMSSGMNFTAGSRTKTSSGKSIMKKVRREAKDIANIHGSLSRTMGAPKGQTQMTRAPQSMINEYRRAAQPSVVPVERPKPKVSEAVKAHEERASFISDSDEDDDVVFDKKSSPRKVKPFSKPAAKPAPKPAPKPSIGSSSSSAAASLLKTRPKTAPVSRPIKSVEPSKAETKDRPIPSNTRPTKTVSSSRPSVAGASSKPPVTSPSKDTTRQSGLPTESRETAPSQPPAGSPPRPQKRKAPNMFMKPNKRVH